MKIAIFLLTLSISFQVFSSYPTVPNPYYTYGSLCTYEDKDFEEARYPEGIAYCKRNVSFGQRNKIYDLYGIPESCRHRYTIDHFIPLSIGGDNSPENLWPEHKLVKALRPRLELTVYELIRDGKVTQQEAIHIIYYAKMTAKEFVASMARASGDFCD